MNHKYVSLKSLDECTQEGSVFALFVCEVCGYERVFPLFDGADSERRTAEWLNECDDSPCDGRVE